MPSTSVIQHPNHHSNRTANKSLLGQNRPMNGRTSSSQIKPSPGVRRAGTAANRALRPERSGRRFEAWLESDIALHFRAPVFQAGSEKLSAGNDSDPLMVMLQLLPRSRTSSGSLRREHRIPCPALIRISQNRRSPHRELVSVY